MPFRVERGSADVRGGFYGAVRLLLFESGAEPVDASVPIHVERARAVSDDGAYRRRRARMTSYRRDGKSSRSHNHNKHRRNRSNQSQGYHQDRGQVNSFSPADDAIS